MKSQQDVKPTCKLLGADNNIFNLIGLASRSLRRAGMREQIEPMTERCFNASSYEEALSIIMEYVDVE